VRASSSVTAHVCTPQYTTAKRKAARHRKAKTRKHSIWFCTQQQHHPQLARPSHAVIRDTKRSKSTMGIPYSRQIHAAFDQVTPLVAAGFEVLQTTKNISILLAAIQVITVVILAMILLTMVALLITMNPDLEAERAAIVTPVVKWCACWAMPECEARGRLTMSVLVLFAVVFVACWVWFSIVTDVKEVAAEEAVATEQREEDEAKGAA
jgi:hypothetical protein